MKLFALRNLMFLIGFSFVFMLYLNLKMLWNDSSRSKTHKSAGFKDALQTLIRGDITGFFYSPTLKTDHGILRSANNHDLPHPTTQRLQGAVLNSSFGVLKPVKEFRSFWKMSTYRNTSFEPPEFVSWRSNAQTLCDGHMVGYNYNFLYASDMTIDRSFCKCSRQGGEAISSVIMQTESDEFYTYEMGCFGSKCSTRPKYDFAGDNHLNNWMFSLSTNKFSPDKVAEDVHVVEEFTIAIVRYEYANVYHTMTDWYNAFLVKEFFNKTAHNTNILLVDAHPSGNLDPVWSHLFNSTSRLSSFPTRTKFKKLAWGIMGYNSPMGIEITSSKLPLYEEFRQFFLDSYGIKTKPADNHNCEAFKVLFVWRRDYVAHPRNPTGTISRKIANEMEIISYLKQKLNKENFQIRALQIDIFEMIEQLRQIVWADILIGMHGAGLTHAVFLRKGSGLIELTPNYWFGNHFAAIASWRGLVYKNWSNNDPLRELPNKSTIIPPPVIYNLIKKTVRDLCSPASIQLLFPSPSSLSSPTSTPPS